MPESIIGSIIIARSGHRFIMVRHRKRKWEFPGGRKEGSESPSQTAERELEEEAGLKGHGWHELGTIKNGSLAIFACSVSGTPDPGRSDVIEARYFTAPPADLSFPREEISDLLTRAGILPKPKTDYDVASRDFDTIRSSNPKHLDDWVRALLRWGGITSGSMVLDAGCGTGRYSIEISGRTGANVIGLDLSGGMLSKANSKKKGIWLRGDATDLPVVDERFDTVIMMLVLQHVDDGPLAISEAFRALKPGGRLVLVTVSHGRIKRHIMRLFPGLVAIDLGRFMSLLELKWHLHNQGFRQVHHHIVKSEAITSGTVDLLDRFRRRYISTLALVPEGDFERNMTIFENRLREQYGDKVETSVELTFIEASKLPDGSKS